MERALKTLRDKKTGTALFRSSAQKLSVFMMRKLSLLLKKRYIPKENLAIVIILRSALVFLDSAIRAFPGTPIGVMGMKRDERSFEPKWYYENLPGLKKRSVVLLLGPMLATGGSAEAAVLRLLERGARTENIYFLGFLAAPEGLRRLARFI